MDNRTLGRSGIEVSPLGMGCWAIGGPWQWLDGPGGWGEVDDDESIRAVHAAMASGITFFDTAATYGTGHSEDVLGRALAGHRDEVVIATKFGFHVDEAAKHVTFRTDPRDVISDLRADCERSLRHLGTDVIDLYQLHVWDYPADLAVELREALEDLVHGGQDPQPTAGAPTTPPWRGCSPTGSTARPSSTTSTSSGTPRRSWRSARRRTSRASTAARSRAAPSPASTRRTRSSRRTTCAATTGRRDTFFTPTLAKLDAVRDILTSGGRTLAQGSLAWIWARSPMTVPIPGIRTVAQAEENAGAMAFGPLTAEQVAQIDALVGRANPTVPEPASWPTPASRAVPVFATSRRTTSSGWRAWRVRPARAGRAADRPTTTSRGSSWCTPDA